MSPAHALRGAIALVGLGLLVLCFVVGPPAVASLGVICGVLIILGLLIGGAGPIKRSVQWVALGSALAILYVTGAGGAPIPVMLWAAVAVPIFVLPLRPRRQSQQRTLPSWRGDWAPVGVEEGRVRIGSASVAIPDGWETWRIPDGTSADETIIVHPAGRRFGIPVPGLMVALASAEGSLDAALDELLRQRQPGEVPVDLRNLRRSQVWIGGESAVLIDGKARLRPEWLPGLGVAWRVGLWLIGFRSSLRGAIAFVDRDDRRYAVGWSAWADADAEGRAAFAEAVSSWRWSDA